MDDLYKIVRYTHGEPPEDRETGLTLEAAQEHCQRPDTRGEGWFDGYTLENPSPETIAARELTDRNLRRMVDVSRRIGGGA